MAIDFSRGSFIPQDFNFSGLGAGAGAAGAQAAANVGNIKAALNNSEYDKIAARAVANDAQKEAAKWGLEAQFQIGGLEALSSVLGNQHMVEAYKENEKTIADAWVEAEAIKRKGSGGGGGGDGGDTNWLAIGLQGAALAAPFFSDERTKHTIEKLDDVTLMLRELNPVSFYYKDEYTNDPERMHYGFIAQEYKDVMPDAVHIDSDSGMYRIDINQLIALLVRGYQQLDNRITRMEVKSVLAGVS